MMKAMDDYTIEDYIKDFELDYLGFDKMPNEPASVPCSKQNARSALEPEPDGIADSIQKPRPL